MKTFKQLAYGQTFDFVSPETSFNSFFDRCVKVSDRKYKSLSTGIEYTIGRKLCPVYNVGKPVFSATHSLGNNYKGE